MRKKLQEMTPYERVEPRLKGLSNEEAEDVAVRILAQIVAKHVHIKKDGEEYFRHLMKTIADAADKYTQDHSFELALGYVVENKLKQRDNSCIIKSI